MGSLNVNYQFTLESRVVVPQNSVSASPVLPARFCCEGVAAPVRRGNADARNRFSTAVQSNQPISKSISIRWDSSEDRFRKAVCMQRPHDEKVSHQNSHSCGVHWSELTSFQSS